MITFRQLIEAVIQVQFDSNLIESADGFSLTDAILEEVSVETWEAIVEAIIDELSEDTLEMIAEGSIKGSGDDRKAVLKKAYRAGEQKTRDFYKKKLTPTPSGDKGITKAFSAGEYSNQGGPASKGAERSKSQDSLKGTEHSRSEKGDYGKTHYKTQTHAQKTYGIANSTQKVKLP